MKLGYAFVDHIPEELNEGVLYVSMHFGTVVHRCACGCGEEVVTPLGPAEWRLTYDGKTISLDPSIGNWGFSCGSHYWIKEGTVKWARRFSETDIALVREEARARRERFYRTEGAKVPREGLRESSWRSIWRWIRTGGGSWTNLDG